MEFFKTGVPNVKTDMGADDVGYPSIIISWLFAAGLEGFKGGLSAENYLAITKTSRATATRELQDLVEIGELQRTGERKHTRYTINIPAVAGSKEKRTAA